eukprot:4332386-Amphidinium_carterae.1
MAFTGSSTSSMPLQPFGVSTVSPATQRFALPSLLVMKNTPSSTSSKEFHQSTTSGPPKEYFKVSVGCEPKLASQACQHTKLASTRSATAPKTAHAALGANSKTSRWVRAWKL